MTFTGFVGAAANFPLRAIIWTCVSLRISPNILTLVGVLLNVVAAWQLAHGRFLSAGVWMTVANIFDYIDGKVAHELEMVTRFGAFLDSVMDRVSDITLFIGLIALYNRVGSGRGDYVLTASLAMMFAVMTSYTRARAESLVEKCKVGFMERPERIVLFMVGAFTNRMAAVLWITLVLSVVTVLDRIYLTWHELEPGRRLNEARASTAPAPLPPAPAGSIRRMITLPGRIFWRAMFWTYDRTTWQYDIMVISVLAFVWLTPPAWLGDPMAMHERGLLEWVWSWVA